VLPANTTYVPGSLQILTGPNAGRKTDAGGDDQANVTGRTVTFRLGTGADANAGGTIGVNVATSVNFRVTVDQAAAGSTISNQGPLSYPAATIGQQFSYLTNAVATDVVANADLVVTKATTDTVTAGDLATSTITVRNNGPNAASGTQV